MIKNEWDNEIIQYDGVNMQIKNTGELEIEGEDIMENMEIDYKGIPKLDIYDEDQLSQGEYDEMGFQERRMADIEVERRYKQQMTQNKRDNRLGEMIFEEGSIKSFIEENPEIASDMQKNREMLFLNKLRGENFDNDENEMDQEEYDFFNAEEMRGNLAKWIKSPRTVNFIRIAFRNFLMQFRDEHKKLVYEQRISHMCSNNRQSLEIDFTHLSDAVPVLGFWFFDSPNLLLPYLNNVVYDVAHRYFPDYGNIHSEVYIKIKNYPLEENLRDLKKEHLNTTVKFKAMVTRRHPVTCQLKKIYYICRCGDRKGPIYQSENNVITLGNCHNCKSKGPFLIDKQNVEYKNHQRIVVQEIPSKVPPGRVARQKNIILLGDNIDSVRPGDQVEVTGFFLSKFDFQMTSKHGFPIFSTFIEANNIVKMEDLDEFEFIEDNVKFEKIVALSKRPDLAEIIFNSIAPNIHGHEHIKKSVALGLFGGNPVVQNSHRIRGDINILMVGDAGMGKSQILKFIQRVIPRTIYTTGKGASAVGLTASVRRDHISGEWVLEGGALVLADQGICLIDEFDKMGENDRTSIHEAMEQQTISISKAGIVATLKARCSVIAAANPIGGKYNKAFSFRRNVDLSDPIISRFDVICILKDESNRMLDRAMGKFILDNHMKALSKNEVDKKEKAEKLEDEGLKNEIKEEGDNKENIKVEDKLKFDNQKPSNYENKFLIKDKKISPEFLKLYIAYAKKFYKPNITKASQKKIEAFYLDLRNHSKQFDGLNIVTRHLESLLRLSQASARMHLKKTVESEDINIAIHVMLTTFIQTQKYNVQNTLKNKFGGYLRIKGDYNVLLKNILEKAMSHQNQLRITAISNNTHFEGMFKMPIEKFKVEASKKRIENIENFIGSKFFNQNFYIRDGFIHQIEN